MYKILYITFLLFNLFYCSCLFSQVNNKHQIPDSLKNKGYTQLDRFYFKNKETDTTKALMYAKAYLQKAKKENNTLSIAKGYQYVGSLDHYDINIKYLDSAISIVKQGTISKTVVGFYHHEKANILFKKRVFKEAIDHLLIANAEGRKYNYSNLIFSSNYLIAILTDRIGNHNDALKILKEYPSYIKDRKINKIDTTLYLNTYFALAVASYKLKKLDSATYYNNIGMQKSLETRVKPNFYNHFVLCSGVILYHQNKFERALDSIEKSIAYFKYHNDKPNLAVSYFYKGKILYENKNKEIGIVNLKKLDTIFQEQNDILPEAREGYQILIQHFKDKKDTQQQLVYTERLIEVDKVLNDNYKHLQTNIIKDYYTPLLISKTVKNKSKAVWKIIYSILALLLLSLFGLFYTTYRQKQYKRKFNLLLQSKKDEQINNQPLSNYKNEDIKKYRKLNLSNEIVQNILKGLNRFETSQKFLQSKYSLNILAKELGTNSSYLSKVINVSKNKNFSSYMNDLRIDYAIDRLKSNRQFRLYSVKGIAEEIGFKNTESFSKAFHKKTGIYPSYFIEQLNK